MPLDSKKEWYPVRVHFPAEGTMPEFWHEDEILAESPEDALARAKRNWPNADMVDVGEGRNIVENSQ